MGDPITLEKILETIEKLGCVCGHPLESHDPDIEMCNECLDVWFHSFSTKPRTWFINVSFTPSLTD